MRFTSWQAGSLLTLAALALLLNGCGKTDNSQTDTKGKSSQVAQTTQEDKKGHDHSGWWCDEHGVPEAECSMCSDKVAAEFKKKGDWCEKHVRAKSQCFICDPSLAAKYAARYEAKYGKKPPVPEENRAENSDKK